MGKLLSVGHIAGGVQGYTLPVAASQMFHPDGGHFVYLDANGRVTLALTATQYLFGWACTPRSFAAGSTNESNGYWTSSSTAGADKVYVITDLTAVFCIPVDSSATLAQARVGEACDLIGVNDGTQQVANPGTSTQDVLLIQGMFHDGDTDYVLVKLNPNEIQRDT